MSVPPRGNRKPTFVVGFHWRISIVVPALTGTHSTTFQETYLDARDSRPLLEKCAEAYAPDWSSMEVAHV